MTNSRDLTTTGAVFTATRLLPSFARRGGWQRSFIGTSRVGMAANKNWQAVKPGLRRFDRKRGLPLTESIG